MHIIKMVHDRVTIRDLNFQIFQIEFQIESNRVNSSHIIFKHLYKLLFQIFKSNFRVNSSHTYFQTFLWIKFTIYHSIVATIYLIYILINYISHYLFVYIIGIYLISSISTIIWNKLKK